MEIRICQVGRRLRRVRLLAGVLLCFGLLFSVPVYASSIFINEFHYDNDGGDVNEGVEIAGPAGTDLAGWSLVFYNGSGGGTYGSSLLLDGKIPDLQGGFGVLPFLKKDIQNGPDGLALLDSFSAVVQFLSYEGSFTAVGGAADGLVSSDIGVNESGTTPVGQSLQMTGAFGNFSWVLADASFGQLNADQTFFTTTSNTPLVPVPTPEPGTFALFGAAVVAVALLRRRVSN